MEENGGEPDHSGALELDWGDDGRLAAGFDKGHSLTDALDPRSQGHSSALVNFDTDINSAAKVDSFPYDGRNHVESIPPLFPVEEASKDAGPFMDSLEQQEDIMRRLDEYMHEFLRNKDLSNVAQRRMSVNDTLLESFTPPLSSPRLGHIASQPGLLNSADGVPGMSTPMGMVMAPSVVSSTVSTPMQPPQLINMTHVPLRRSSTASSLPGTMSNSPFGLNPNGSPAINIQPVLGTSTSADMPQYSIVSLGTMSPTTVIQGHQQVTRTYSSPLNGAGTYHVVSGQNPLGQVFFTTAMPAQSLLLTSVMSSPLPLVQPVSMQPISQPLFNGPSPLVSSPFVNTQSIHNTLPTGTAPMSQMPQMHASSYIPSHTSLSTQAMGVMSDQRAATVSGQIPQFATLTFPTPDYTTLDHWHTPSCDVENEAWFPGTRPFSRFGSTENCASTASVTPRRPSKLKNSGTSQKEKSTTPQGRGRSDSFPNILRSVVSAPTTPVASFANMQLINTTPASSIEPPTMALLTPQSFNERMTTSGFTSDTASIISPRPSVSSDVDGTMQYQLHVPALVLPPVNGHAAAGTNSPHSVDVRMSTASVGRRAQTLESETRDVSAEESTEPSSDSDQDAPSPSTLAVGCNESTMGTATDCTDESKTEKHCLVCGVTQTPQWRGNPTGGGYLCNRFGLRVREQDKDNKRRNQRRRDLYKLRKEKKSNAARSQHS